jgi:hypothetical protein
MDFRPEKTKSSMPTKFQVVEICVEQTADSRYGRCPYLMSSQKAMVLTTHGGEAGRPLLAGGEKGAHAQPGQVGGETEALAEAGLALAGVAGGEAEADLGHPQPTAGHGLEEDLETDRSQ